MRKIIATIIATIIAGVALSVGLTLPAQAGTVDFYDNSWSEPAHTKAGKGVIYGPMASCSNDDYEPDSYRLVAKRNGKTYVGKLYKSSYVPTHSIRVKRGTYRVTATARCGSTTKTVSSTVRVGYLKDSQTVSRGEWKRIHKGQSLAKISKIIGHKPSYRYTVRGTRNYTIRNTHLDGNSWFEFRKGKLVDKQWYNYYVD